jgi:hypothetical protein
MFHPGSVKIGGTWQLAHIAMLEHATRTDARDVLVAELSHHGNS